MALTEAASNFPTASATISCGRRSAHSSSGQRAPDPHLYRPAITLDDMPEIFVNREKARVVHIFYRGSSIVRANCFKPSARDVKLKHRAQKERRPGTPTLFLQTDCM